MQIGNYQHNYQWTEKWGRIPDTDSAREGWAHHGIVVSNTINVISFHQGEKNLITFLGEVKLVFSVNLI